MPTIKIDQKHIESFMKDPAKVALAIEPIYDFPELSSIGQNKTTKLTGNMFETTTKKGSKLFQAETTDGGRVPFAVHQYESIKKDAEVVITFTGNLTGTYPDTASGTDKPYSIKQYFMAFV